jgi:membrane protease YdiL (CAAX protease family)
MKTRVLQDEPGDRRHHVPVDTVPRGKPARPPGLGGVSSLVRRHALTTFFVLSCAFSWCLVPVGTFLPFGPLLAALVVVSVTGGRAGLRRLGARLVRWRVRWVWYVAAVGIPVAVHVATSWLNVGLGASSPSLGQFSPWHAVLVVIGLRLVDPLDGALGEEPGFRGYAQPRLQSGLTPLRATAALAAFVAVWHLPLLLMGADGMQPVDLVGSVAVTFWYAWLFNHTGGSVLLTLVAHATEGSVQTGSLWAVGDDASRQTLLYSLVWASVAVALVVLDRRAWLCAPETAVDPARRPDLEKTKPSEKP